MLLFLVLLALIRVLQPASLFGCFCTVFKTKTGYLLESGSKPILTLRKLLVRIQFLYWTMCAGVLNLMK